MHADAANNIHEWDIAATSYSGLLRD